MCVIIKRGVQTSEPPSRERDQRPVFKLIEGKICKYRGCSGVQHLTILWAYHFVEPGPPQWNNTAWVHWRRPAVMARCCLDRVAAPLSCQDLETCHRNLAPCPNLMAAWSDMSSSWLFALVFVTYWNKALQQTENMLKLTSRRVGEPFIAGFIFFFSNVTLVMSNIFCNLTFFGHITAKRTEHTRTYTHSHAIHKLQSVALWSHFRATHASLNPFQVPLVFSTCSLMSRMIRC